MIIEDSLCIGKDMEGKGRMGQNRLFESLKLNLVHAEFNEYIQSSRIMMVEGTWD